VFIVRQLRNNNVPDCVVNISSRWVWFSLTWIIMWCSWVQREWKNTRAATTLSPSCRSVKFYIVLKVCFNYFSRSSIDNVSNCLVDKIKSSPMRDAGGPRPKCFRSLKLCSNTTNKALPIDDLFRGTSN